jgi:hypothetical protein
MAPGGEAHTDLFGQQVARLTDAHFLVLSWAATAEDRKTRYNITNAFDDLKFLAITRTKQNAVAVIEALAALCFVDLRGEGNRRNLYITAHGARALERLVLSRRFNPRASAFLEGHRS